MNRRYIFLTSILAIIAVIMAFGPRPPADTTIRFDPVALGSDLDAYLREAEAGIPELKPGAAREIVWAGEPGAMTDWSLVYLHGFSATKMEMRPLPDDVARALGANLYFARLTGHGRDGAALAEPELGDWINDTAEAIAIGDRIGRNVVLMGGSTGATLAVLAASRPRFARQLAGLILLSPNFAVRGASTGLLNMPWGEEILPLFVGRTRSFKPLNEQQAQWWTTSYPIRALFAVGALLRVVSNLDLSKIRVPALFLYAPDDRVIEPRAVVAAHARWGGPKQITVVTGSVDPAHHIIAGDIMSPATTDRVTRICLDWIGSLR